MAKPPLDFLLQPRTFARGWGAILVLLVVIGVVTEFVSNGLFIPGFLAFDWTHDGLHIGLLALALYMGFRAPDRVVVLYARTFGFGGLIMAVLGFVPASNAFLADTYGLHLELGENIVHGLLGVWGLASGFRAHTPRAVQVLPPANGPTSPTKGTTPPRGRSKPVPRKSKPAPRRNG